MGSTKMCPGITRHILGSQGKKILGFFFALMVGESKKKNDFDLYKGFSMEKMAQILPDFKEKIKSKLPNFYDKFLQVAKNIEGFYFFFKNSYLVYSLIWPNHLMDDCHFCYITKLEKKNPNVKMHRNLTYTKSKINFFFKHPYVVIATYYNLIKKSTKTYYFYFFKF
jgi:hypothetical protein